MSTIVTQDTVSLTLTHDEWAAAYRAGWTACEQWHADYCPGAPPSDPRAAWALGYDDCLHELDMTANAERGL